LQRTARQKVIAGLYVGHGDSVATLAQGSIFVQLDGLRDII
jgi:hypothetical protein